MLSVGISSATTIFSHDFENAPNPGTAVTSVADLGAPAAGSFSFSGSPVGGIGGSRPSLAVGNRVGNPINNMTEMATNSVVTSFTYPETVVADSGGGDLVFADFASPGGFTGGDSTTISLNMASFGNNNTEQFKYQFIRGLDASDNEVFELLLVSGSGALIRQVYARGADDDSTTFSAAGSGTPEGDLLANNFAFNLNGTSVSGGRPSGTYAFSIVLENGTVTYDIGTTGGGFTTTATNGTALPINSGATSINRLEFSSVWNASADGQNKGYWVDDIIATTETVAIPEPSSSLLLLASASVLAFRNRK